MKHETIVLNQERNVTLTAYIQAVGEPFLHMPRRPAILILPGGGYQYCSPREADPVAFAYLKAGYQAFVLCYSVAEHNTWPNPLEDYEQAMELIRANADQWGLYPDKIAVIGFSAGGHLAAAAATMARNRPNAAILGYAVAGEDVKGCNPTAPNTVDHVDGRTCPCFLFATRTDDVVPVENSVEFMQALIQANVSFESHIYNFGPHGFSTCDSSVHDYSVPISDRVPNWVGDSIGWLRDMFGAFGKGYMEEPVCKPHVTGDYDANLSVNCTIGHLLENPEARALLDDLVSGVEKGELDEAALGKITLRGLYGFMKVPGEVIEELDEKLKKIKNA